MPTAVTGSSSTSAKISVIAETISEPGLASFTFSPELSLGRTNRRAPCARCTVSLSRNHSLSTSLRCSSPCQSACSPAFPLAAIPADNLDNHDFHHAGRGHNREVTGYADVDLRDHLIRHRLAKLRPISDVLFAGVPVGDQ